MDIKKGAGVDKIPLKFVKQQAIILSEPLKKTINDSLYLVAYFQMQPKSLLSHQLIRAPTIKTVFSILRL